MNVIDAFFAQIQGSVRVRLEDGSMLRLNYDAQNGHPYTAVGRFLIERKIYHARRNLDAENPRMDGSQSRTRARRCGARTSRMCFSSETALGAEDEPPGAQGVALTPGRSIAVDRNLHTYGMPFFIDAVLPIQSEKPDTKFRRLMIAQDTGGAIIGPARADIYLGAGDEAARAAGRFKQFGRFVMLVPNELDPARLERGDVPLPLPRPKLDETDQDGGAAAMRRRLPPAPADDRSAAPEAIVDKTDAAAESEPAQEKTMSRDEGRKGRRLSDDETRALARGHGGIAPLRKARSLGKSIERRQPRREPARETAREKPCRPPRKLRRSSSRNRNRHRRRRWRRLDRKTKSRIARGTHAIDAQLDLHGHTQAEAHDALLRFLRRAQRQGRERGAGDHRQGRARRRRARRAQAPGADVAVAAGIPRLRRRLR